MTERWTSWEENDEQVKLRASRIELGEIAATLKKHPDVQDAVVLVREAGGEKQLLAYVVATDRHEERSGDDQQLGRLLQNYLRQSLPDYMVPAAVMTLLSWPLTASGKLDRSALPLPEGKREGYHAPRTPQEHILCDIFAEVLSLDRVGLEDNFFALGGHSLMAMRLITRVRAVLGTDLAVRTLFESPTVAQLAPRIGRNCFSG